MQTVLCDICERPVRGQAYEFHFIHGEAVNTETGQPRIVQRGGTRMMYLCSPCGGWVQTAMDHLREAHQEADRVEHHLGARPR